MHRGYSGLLSRVGYSTGLRPKLSKSSMRNSKPGRGGGRDGILPTSDPNFLSVLREKFRFGGGGVFCWPQTQTPKLSKCCMRSSSRGGGDSDGLIPNFLSPPREVTILRGGVALGKIGCSA